MTREQKFIHFFSDLSVTNVNDIHNVFAENAHFKDPFNDVNGVASIITVFTHMFATTENPKFIVNHHAIEQDTLFIQWTFLFTKKGRSWDVEGTSMVTFDENDRVKRHIDYWDPAEQIYSKIGLLKPIMNFLKSRLTAN